MRRWLLACLFMLIAVPAVNAATATVCASGCTFNNTQLQSALDAANGGDTVLLQQGFTYVGAFTLHRHGTTNEITVRTGVTSTGTVVATSVFPAANIRMTPALATAANLAILQPNANNASALDVAAPSAGVSPEYWRIKWVTFAPHSFQGGSLVRVGNQAVITKNAELPTHITLEQIYVHGDPIKGQKRGIEIHGNFVTVQDSYVEHIKNVGSDGQALWSDGSSDLTITNNYLEGGTETVLLGGSAGPATHSTTITGGASSTGATLADVTDLSVGQGFTVECSTVEKWSEVATLNVGAKTITWLPDIGCTPDVPGDVDWGVVPQRLTFTKNYVTKNPTNRNNIVGTPQSVTVTGNDAGGTLTGGTFTYRVVARLTIAEGSVAKSAASAEISDTVTVGATTGSMVIQWAPVTNADTYYIYGRSAGSENKRFSVTTSACTGSPSRCTFTDTGAAGTTEVVTTAGTDWTVKNAFEIKNHDTATIEGNVFEYAWLQGQRGDCVLFTPAGSNDDSTRDGNLTFRYNIIRHCAGGFQIMGRDQSAPGGNVSSQTKNITITQLLGYDIGPQWGGNDRFMYMGAGNNPSAYPFQVASPDLTAPTGLTITHVTWDAPAANSFIFFDMFHAATHRVIDFTLKDNLFFKADNGLTGANSCAQGSGCWTRYTGGAALWDKVVVAGATCANYPTGTICPTAVTLTSYWTNPAAGDYTLKAGTPYKNAASDGTDIGANMALITPFTNIAITGTNTGAPPALPPTIATTSLSNGTRNQVYTATLIATTCGTGCVWSVSDGALPTGLVLSTAGLLSGTPTVADLFTFTARAVASNGLSASTPLAITIADLSTTATPTTSRASRSNYIDNATMANADEPTTTYDGGPLRTGDIWVDLTAGVFKWLTTTSPTPTWAEFVHKVSGSAIASLGASGTPSSTTFLRGDNTWAAASTTLATPWNVTLRADGGNFSAAADTNPQEIDSSGRHRAGLDLTNAAEMRVLVQGQAVAVTAKICFDYSTNNGGAWTDSGICVTLSTSSNTFVTGTWTAIPSLMKADVLIRPMFRNKNGTETPSVANLYAQVR